MANETIVTNKVRISYEHLTQPYANQPGQEPKFSAALLIPKSDTVTIQKINAAIQQTITDGINDKWGGVRPPQPPIPIHDGDGLKQNGEPYGEECKGHWVMTASSKQRPEVVDINLNPILDASQIYSGMYARVSIRFFAYNTAGKRGIGCGLGNVQKLEDGEPLGGKTSAADDFGAQAAPWNQPAQAQYTQPTYQQPAQTQYQPQPQYQQPAPMQYQQPQYQQPIDLITGQPAANQPIGGIMGLGQ